MREISGRVVGGIHRWRCLVVTREYFINPLAPELFFLILAHPVYKV